MSAILDALAAEPGCELVRAGTLDDFLARHPRALVFLTGDIEPTSPHRRSTHPAPGSCLPDNRSNLRTHRGSHRARRTCLPAHRTCIPAHRSHTPRTSQAHARRTAAASRVVGATYRTMRDAIRLAAVTAAHVASAFPTIASPPCRARKRHRVKGLQVRISRTVTAEGRKGSSRDSGDSCRASECCRRGSGSRRRDCGCIRRG